MKSLEELEREHALCTARIKDTENKLSSLKKKQLKLSEEIIALILRHK